MNIGRKYRIVEFTDDEGKHFFGVQPQIKIFFFSFWIVGSIHETLEEAIKEVEEEQLKDGKIVRIFE